MGATFTEGGWHTDLFDFFLDAALVIRIHGVQCRALRCCGLQLEQLAKCGLKLVGGAMQQPLPELRMPLKDGSRQV